MRLIFQIILSFLIVGPAMLIAEPIPYCRIGLIEKKREGEGAPSFHLPTPESIDSDTLFHMAVDANTPCQVLVLPWDRKQKRPVDGWEPVLLDLARFSAILLPNARTDRRIPLPRATRIYLAVFQGESDELETVSELLKADRSKEDRAADAVRLKTLLDTWIAREESRDAPAPRRLAPVDFGGVVRGGDWDLLPWRKQFESIRVKDTGFGVATIEIQPEKR